MRQGILNKSVITLLSFVLYIGLVKSTAQPSVIKDLNFEVLTDTIRIDAEYINHEQPKVVLIAVKMKNNSIFPVYMPGFRQVIYSLSTRVPCHEEAAKVRGSASIMAFYSKDKKSDDIIVELHTADGIDHWDTTAYLQVSGLKFRVASLQDAVLLGPFEEEIIYVKMKYNYFWGLVKEPGLYYTKITYFSGINQGHNLPVSMQNILQEEYKAVIFRGCWESEFIPVVVK